MSYLGTNKIGKMYLGSTEIAKAYLGSDLVYKKKSALPYDSEIEYLESTGTQYIDTNIARSSGHAYEVVADICPISFDGKPMFSVGSDYTGYFVSAFTGNKLGFNTSYYIINNGVRQSYTYNQSSNGRKCTLTDGINTTSVNRSSANYSGYTIKLFCNVTSNKGTLKFYKFNVKEDASIVLDLIPVRCGTTGYMYDRVSGTLFGNAGTGDFILGNDKN